MPKGLYPATRQGPEEYREGKSLIGAWAIPLSIWDMTGSVIFDTLFLPYDSIHYLFYESDNKQVNDNKIDLSNPEEPDR